MVRLNHHLATFVLSVIIFTNGNAQQIVEIPSDTDSGLALRNNLTEEDSTILPPQSPLPDNYDETLLEIARKPVIFNPSNSAKTCTPVCSEGPQLACPEDGDCGTDSTCCYDMCRKRQICGKSSIPTPSRASDIKKPNSNQ